MKISDRWRCYNSQLFQIQGGGFFLDLRRLSDLKHQLFVTLNTFWTHFNICEVILKTFS